VLFITAFAVVLENKGFFMKIEDILNELKKLGNTKAIEGMKRFGIKPSKSYGVSILNLRKLSKRF